MVPTSATYGLLHNLPLLCNGNSVQIDLRLNIDDDNEDSDSGNRDDITKAVNELPLTTHLISGLEFVCYKDDLRHGPRFIWSAPQLKSGASLLNS